MNQRQRALALVREIGNNILDEDHIDKLDYVLAEAQNRPPQGGADGSLGEAEWTRLRGLCDACRDACYELRHYTLELGAM